MCRRPVGLGAKRVTIMRPPYAEPLTFRSGDATLGNRFLSLGSMTTLTLNGPRQAAAAGAAKQLIVLLHGYGADGHDLFGLVPVLAPMFPHAAFVSPDAPFRCEMGFGFQWFPLADRSAASITAGVLMARPILNAFLDAELAAHGLDEANMALIGFSQGTMMALDVGLRRRKAPAGIVGYSGRLVPTGDWAAEITARPPVLLVHGDQDPLVPVAALHEAVQTLKAQGVNVEGYVRPGLPHSIDEGGLVLGQAFLKRCLPDG